MKVTLTTKRNVSMAIPKVLATQLVVGSYYVVVFSESDEHGVVTHRKDMFCAVESSLTSSVTGKKAVVLYCAASQMKMTLRDLGMSAQFFGPINVNVELPVEEVEVVAE